MLYLLQLGLWIMFPILSTRLLQFLNFVGISVLFGYCLRSSDILQGNTSYTTSYRTDSTDSRTI